MIAGLDSAYAPSDASIAAAKVGGEGCWAGYFAGPGILNGWSEQDFHRVQIGGLATFAYCSGWSDPIAMKAQSLTWDVPIALDVEGGIRADGAWVQGWIDSAASGLYGNAGVHKNRTAAFQIVAAYPSGDPHATWPAFLVKPGVPCGWQWQGTHSAYGASVDSSWLDDDLVGQFGGGGGIITSPVKRSVSVATATSLHQFGRGTDNALYTRKRSGGTWGAWTKLGGTLTSDQIAAGLDDAGAICVSVTGAGGVIFDIASADDGGTWNAFSDSTGAVTGLTALSASVAAVAPTVHVTGQITGTIGGSFNG